MPSPGLSNESQRAAATVALVTPRVIVVTGASDGIGAAAARLLSAQGHHVVVVGRSPDKTEQVAAEIGAPFYLADFTRLSEVRALAERLTAELPRIDVLANNAGGIMGRRAITEDGNEKTVQVNHLAPFLLTSLLLERLVASRGTVISTASVAHRSAAPLDLDDLTFSRRYRPGRAYAASKLMNILFASELDRRFGSAGLRAASFHPGVVNTNFSSEHGGLLHFGYQLVAARAFRSAFRGAETLTWLATTDVWEAGEYFKDCRRHRRTRQASDPRLARELWDRSVKLTSAP